ncbi:hypothetical protein [Sphingomonas lycopersici]|uniref:Secreted protein n=1 Tax=Sphingomonas lycopersici TaxID=2951807 RepID=A0AA41ZEG4_9SPHN|nr:hypothetical protein [Sphingomonas lycopersici]MCW6535419.1 hypothetical protein [Sphingomonas lycopersici]
MRARLSCTNCGALLTAMITIPPLANPMEAELAFVDQKPLTPPGTAFLSSTPMSGSTDKQRRAPLDFSPQYWLNPQDVEAAVEPVDDPHRLNGCCGLDGCDGPNMRCRICKTEVGTRQSDCWTSDVFIPEPGVTRWLEQQT